MWSFADRAEAGRRLAPLVAELPLPDPVVLGLPRGGVPVAAEVAHALRAPLDVYVVRKVGAPAHPELGVGAVAEDGVPVFDPRTLRRLRLTPADLERTVRAERAEVARRVERYREGRPLTPVEGRDVVVVDDGLATGATAHAALLALRRAEPRTLVLAVPVAARATAERMGGEADRIVCVTTPEEFFAVGEFYEDFSPTSDGQVLRLLHTAARAAAPDRGAGG